MHGGKEMAPQMNFLLSSVSLGPVWQALYIGHREITEDFVVVFLFFKKTKPFLSGSFVPDFFQLV